MSNNKPANDEDDFFATDDDDEDGQENKYLLFRIGRETYGIEIRWVTGIEEMQKITEVPDLPDYVKGVINLRGKIIPAMSVRKRFSMEDRDYDDRTCIIIVNIDDIVLGLIVDTVAEVLCIPRSNIETPPNFEGDNRSLYLSGLAKVGEEVKILLDVKKILHRQDLSRLRESHEKKVLETEKV